MEFKSNEKSVGNVLILLALIFGTGVVYWEKVLPYEETKISLPSGLAIVQDRQNFSSDKDLLTTRSLDGSTVWVFPVSKDYETKKSEHVYVQRFVGKYTKKVDEHLIGDYKYDVKLEYPNGGAQ